MATVRDLARRLAAGQIGVATVVASLETRQVWPAEPEVTASGAAGVDDVSLPDDDSPEWLYLTSGIDAVTLTALYEACRRSPGWPNR